MRKTDEFTNAGGRATLAHVFSAQTFKTRRNSCKTPTMTSDEILRCVFLCTLLCSALQIVTAQNEHQLSPRFLKQPQGGYVSLGERRTLRCEAVGAPAPRLQLLKDGRPLTGWATLRLVHVLHGVNMSHAGTYQCLAKNAAGALLSAKTRLQVAHLTATEESPEAVPVAVRKGGHVILEPPVVDSVPPATAVWMRLGGSTSLDTKNYASLQVGARWARTCRCLG